VHWLVGYILSHGAAQYNHASPVPPGPDATCPVTLRTMDDTLEQPKLSSDLNTSSTRDEDREQDSSGDEDGGLDWTKLPYVHLPLH
jgi:hypothetical protein